MCPLEPHLIDVSILSRMPLRSFMTLNITTAGTNKLIANKLYLTAKRRLQRHMMKANLADSRKTCGVLGFIVELNCRFCSLTLLTLLVCTTAFFFSKAALNLSKGIYKSIKDTRERSGKHDFMGENLCISLLVCGIYCAFCKVSTCCELKKKLKHIGREHLKKKSHKMKNSN